MVRRSQDWLRPTLGKYDDEMETNLQQLQYLPVAVTDCVSINAVSGMSSCIRLINCTHTFRDMSDSVSTILADSIPIIATV